MLTLDTMKVTTHLSEYEVLVNLGAKLRLRDEKTDICYYALTGISCLDS